MADTEAQLLSDLLSDIAREDACLEAPHLEARVMASSAASSAVRLASPLIRPKPLTTYVVIAAAIVAAVLVPAIFWMKAQVPPPAVPAVVTIESIPDSPESVVPKHSRPVRPVRLRASLAERTAASPSVEPIGQTPLPITHLPASQSPSPASPYEFLPLMPMTEQELTGQFQLVRVQMPRASLGALQSPLEHPHELIEADVLLGQDGMARAIRVSTSGPVYPWRSR